MASPRPFVEAFARGASHAYKSYPIKKRTGGTREINHPSKQLKGLQRWLLANVIEGLPVHPAATAYQKGKSIFDNAAVHANSKFLLRMDFTNFFPSITEGDLKRYIRERSLLFTEWTTLDIDVFCRLLCRKSALTIGAPTSPGISNAICYDMDSAITTLCIARNVAYTRYADDLFFSTRSRDVLRPLEMDISTLIAGLQMPGHLAINAAKTRHSSKRRARRVTGIVLGCDGTPYIGRDLKRKIRAMIYQIDSLDGPARLKLAGFLSYAVGFDPDFMNSLITKYGHPLMRKARTPSI